MNSGKQQPTPGMLESQKMAQEQMMAYYKTQLPALGFAVKTTDASAGGTDQMGADEASAAGREAINAGEKKAIGNPSVLPGSGAFVSRFAGTASKGAGITSVNEGVGRVAGQMKTNAARSGIIQVGDQMEKKANDAVATIGGTEAGESGAVQQASNQRQQAGTALGTSALLALAA